MYNNSREDGMSRPAGRTQSRDYRPGDYPPLPKGTQSRYKETREVGGDYNYDYAAARRKALSTNVKASSAGGVDGDYNYDYAAARRKALYTNVKASSAYPKIPLNSNRSVHTSMMDDHLKAEMTKTDNLIHDFAQVQYDSLHAYVKSIDGETNGAWTDWFDNKRKQLMDHGKKAGEKAGLWAAKNKDSADDRGDGDDRGDEDDRYDRHYRASSAKGRRHLEQGEIPNHGKGGNSP
jgi:hypothetical protein